jgi:hypothetical protein
MNFFWYHDKIIQQYLKVKFSNSDLTEHQFGNEHYQKLHQINLCFSSKPWGMLHDITNHVKHPFNIVTKTPYQYSVQEKSFDDICIATAEKITKITDRNIAVSWSGGIDSTVALVALMQTVPHNRLTVVCNRASIEEFPSFYEEKIKNQLNTISPLELNQNFSNFFTVGGDGGDTVWGVLDDSFWGEYQSNMHSPWVDNINRAVIDDIDFIEEFCSWSEVNITTWLELRIWFYLCCKWQDKCMKPYFLYQNVTNADVAAFYDIDQSFQHWTMNNLDKIIGKKWEDYKVPAKQFIYNYHADSDYLKNKSKVNSVGLDTELASVHQSYLRIAVLEDFSGPKLPSWPFIDYSEIEDFNDATTLIPQVLV